MDMIDCASFDAHRYKVVLGTLDMKDADVEWVLRPYMNTAKKRSYLAMEEK